MKKSFWSAAILLMAILFFCRCTNSNSPSPIFSAVPMKDFHYENANMASGTEVNILGASGGIKNENNKVNYSQFIVLNLATGDTVRVLAAFISVGDPAYPDNMVYTFPKQFDGNKGIRSATFQIPNGDQQMIMKVSGSLDAGGTPDEKKLDAALKDSVPQEEFVVSPKNIAFFDRHYKTIIGVLNFKQQPW